MKSLDTFESVVLFRALRAVILLLLFAAAFLGAERTYRYSLSLRPPAIQVSAPEVRQELEARPERISPTAESKPEEGLLGGELQSFLDAFDPLEYDRQQLRAVALDWLNQYPEPEGKLDFIHELRTVVTSFPSKERGSAAYAFARLKYRRSAAELHWRQGLEGTRTALLAQLAMCLGIATACSLLLVLLRIERNTRPRPS